MTAHTPGPWAVWPMGRILAITCTGRSKPHPSEGMHVAAVHMPEHNTQHDELWHANARLIASAPELLEALEKAELHLAAIGTPRDAQGRYHKDGEWTFGDALPRDADAREVSAAFALVRAAIAKAKGEQS